MKLREDARSWDRHGNTGCTRKNARDGRPKLRKQEDQDLFFDMAKAWTNIALVEGDVAKLAAQELPKRAPRLVGVGDDDAQDGAQSV